MLKYITKVQRRFGQRFAGWRFGTLFFSILTWNAFLINFAVTIWASTAPRSTAERHVLVDGDCNRVKTLNSWIHVAINILSTAMLSGSNYTMQCLSAPTREEIDRAHAMRRWLDIGIPGFRNLRYINSRRIFLWILLAITSLPLHLFYNSAVFSSVSSNDYYGFSVKSSFLEASECSNCTIEQDQDGSEVLNRMWSKAREGKLDRLENADCIDQYAAIVQSKRGHLFLVSNEDDVPQSTAYDAQKPFGIHGWFENQASDAEASTDQASNMYNWICYDYDYYAPCGDNKNGTKNWPAYSDIGEDFCREIRGTCDGHVTKVKTASTYWLVSSLPVRYCLSERTTPHCKLQYHSGILILVTALNFVKAAIMLYITFKVHDEPIMGIGDAVASFLEVSDPTTRNMCLLSIDDVIKDKYTPKPKIWREIRSRWKDAIDILRWITTITIIIVVIVMTSSFYPMTFGQRSSKDLGQLTFADNDMHYVAYFLPLPKGIVGISLIANSPQVILSILYFSYNAVFTNMLHGREWNSYASKRKGLRLSRLGSGEQRTTYFLELPYRYAIPLIAMSGLMHWLLSQSIFIISVDFYNALGLPGSKGSMNGDDEHWNTLGFSPIAMVSLFIVALLMVLALVCFGHIWHKGSMTLAGSCSIAISAACHPFQEEADGVGEFAIYEKKLQWGVVGLSEDGVGHCSFSSSRVKRPEYGALYA